MTKENNVGIIRSGFPKGTHVTTERGKVLIEDLRISDSVLTDRKKFIPVKNIKKKVETGHFLLSSHGLEPLAVSAKGEVHVRDVVFKEDNGQTVPLISWPYFVSVKKLDPSKHMMLSPYNPHSLNPYREISSHNKSTASTYTDNEEQVWLQIEKIEFSGEVVDVFHIELEQDCGIAVEYLSVK